MFHFYDGYHFFGMHLMWWVFWIVFVSVLFGPYEPVRRNRDIKKD
jgi:putative membrane protein